MTFYRIHGSAQPSAQGFAAGPAITVTNYRRLLPSTARAGGGEFVAQSDELVRVELENGFVLWTRADDLLRERGRLSPARDGSQAWEIDLGPVRRGEERDGRGERGLLGLGIKLLEFFGIDLAEKAARQIGVALEEKMLWSKTPGLYRCALGERFELTALAAGETIPAPPAGLPLLIFLHGTASSTLSAFGHLWSGKDAANATRRALAEKYGDRVYAWEHRSVTQSPITNALELAERLPSGAEIHLVSHSRGGLVGELLCLGQRDREQDPLRSGLMKDLFAFDRTMAEQLGLCPLHPDAARERDQAYDADRRNLVKLLKELDARQVRIRRFVRVACPARGTTLASGRLDRWLSVLNHLTGNGLVADGADFLLAVVKERTDPRTLPGLEAMMPGSALTRLLQHPALVTAADLSVIAGDSEGDGLWGQIKLLAADWFYGAEHDLVVNTGSMYGGLRRPLGGARFLRDQGGDVSHFNYFANEKSLRWLAAGLLRGEGSDGGFLPVAQARQEEPRWREAVRRSRDAVTPRPLAVVIPGTMGSALRVRGEAVWLDYWSLLRGGLKKIDMAAGDVEPTDLLGDFYGPLLEFLARSHRVEVFPYDWRRSVRAAAKALARKLADYLPAAERDKQPVHLVAHSMGGLVVRAMIADEGEGAALWRRVKALPGSRLLMLGTPNLGSHEAVRWLTGCNPTEAKLSLLDLTQSTDQIVNLVRQFPGLVELLPFATQYESFGRPETWTSLRALLGARWLAVEEGVLRQARDTWSLLRQAPPEPDFMIYVAGCQSATVADYRLESHAEPWLAQRKRIEFDATRRGDGTVSWASGLLPGVPAWYALDTAHDELCRRKNNLPGYLDLLMTGKTTRLSAVAPESARAQAGIPELFALPPVPPADDIPDADATLLFGFGPGRPRGEADERSVVPLIDICVRHGDLAYARYPVLVGHYAGDVMVSAEAAVDQRLDGALSERQRLGLYPGLARTHAVFFNENPKGKPGGAIVIGLGQVGELSARLLETGVRDALLDYALQVAKWPDERFGAKGSVRSAAVSCLLVGSGPGGVALVDSLEALLRGAVAANARLENAAMDNRVLIDRLEFLELFEDSAIAAAGALENLLRDGPLAASVSWSRPVVEEGQGRRRRVCFADAPGWWYRLEIVEEKSGGLRFIASTDRARAEVTQATGQLRLAENFIRQASRSPASNPDVAKTLFEMLLPNRLKELAPNQGDLVLLVDEASARFPWELLEDRWSQCGRPPAVVAGMVRQFKTPVFRPRPAHAAATTAYVVGNPNLDGWKLFPDLPGAREEAQKVAGLLGARGYKVRECIDENADQVIDGLHQDAWRILHLAGHGEHRMELEFELDGTADRDGVADDVRRPRKTRVSGMVIGKNTFLTPGDVEQMRWVPELVFINCCHLGKTQAAGHGEYSPLAANLAAQFIEMGVKAVVAAGWAVDDAAATTFAESFYQHLLGGRPFGEAVRAAREEIWGRFPQVNTWGAYQCYGDPGFRLADDGSRPPLAFRYHAAAELVADLYNLLESTRMQIRQNDDAKSLAAMREDIGTLLAGIPDKQREIWLARADVAAALGFVWGETAAYDDAIAWLERALAAGDGDCPLRAVEQCANFRVRRAGEQWQRRRDAGQADARASAPLVKEIEAAMRELDLVAERAPSGERLDLLGSASKCLAWVVSDEALRREALLKMSAYYRRAYELAGKADPSSFANWAAAEILLNGVDPARSSELLPTLDEQCRRMADLARENNAREPDFRAAVGEAECELARVLPQSPPEPAEFERIAAIYRQARIRGASPRELATAREHIDFLCDVLDAPGSPRHAALLTIRSML